MPKILLIEDYEDSARLVMRALRTSDCQVVHAKDGETGLQMAIAEQPDLILLDLGLPDVEGQTLAALLKRQEGLAQVPLVALTAWPEHTAKQMAEAYGCDGYISKPIDTRAFPAQVAQYLELDL